MNLANEEQKSELKSCLDGELSDDDKVNRVKAVYDQLKIPQLSQLKMKTYFDRGMEALAKVNVAQEKKQPLMDIAEELMYRNI